MVASCPRSGRFSRRSRTGRARPSGPTSPMCSRTPEGNMLVAAKRLLRHTDNRTGTRGRWEYWLTRYEGQLVGPGRGGPAEFRPVQHPHQLRAIVRRKLMAGLADRQPHDGLRAPADPRRGVGGPDRACRPRRPARTQGAGAGGGRGQGLAPGRIGGSGRDARIPHERPRTASPDRSRRLPPTHRAELGRRRKAMTATFRSSTAT